MGLQPSEKAARLIDPLIWLGSGLVTSAILLYLGILIILSSESTDASYLQ